LDSIWQKKVAKLEAEVHTAKAEASDLYREIRTLSARNLVRCHLALGLFFLLTQFGSQ